MALLAIEGFEGAGTTEGSGTGGTNMRDYLKSKYVLYSSTVAASSVRVVAGYGSGKALSWGGNASADLNFLDIPLGINLTEGWVGFAIKPRLTQSVILRPVIKWRSSTHSEDHVDMRILENMHLVFYRDQFSPLPGPDIQVTANVLQPDRWTYIEIRLLISNTVGEIEVKANGIQVLNETNLDTLGDSGATGFDTIRLLGGDGADDSDISEQWLIDDFYALDGTGSANNTFLGPIKVETLFPSAEGTTINFTPSTGTDNSANVDENPKTDDTDYNSSLDTASNKDLFAADNLTSITTINAVQVVNQARVEEAGVSVYNQS